MIGRTSRRDGRGAAGAAGDDCLSDRGFRPVHLATVPCLGFMILIAIVFRRWAWHWVQSADMQGFQLIMNFLVLPLFFLSGALFPLGGLPRALAVVTTLDPSRTGLTVCGPSARTVALRRVVDLEVLVALAMVLLVFGAYRFSKIEI